MKRQALTEAAFQQHVVDYARLNGWWVYHTHDSRHSQAGFPDLTMCRGHRLLFAELKTETGLISPAQLDVITRLRSTPAEVYVWRPSDFDTARMILTRDGGRNG